MVTVNILDASALITGGIPENKNITVEEVYEEVKDEKSKLEMDLNSINVERAKEEYLKKVGEVAEETGDVYKLSIPDKKLIALALEHREKGENTKMISDDYAIQNMMEKLDIPYKGVRQKEINKKIVWKKICKGCKRKIDKSTLEKCPYCGTELKLISEEQKNIENE